MAVSGSTDIVLKILSGVQSGVDIVLAEGDYTLGSGSADDILIFDVSLSVAHLRIAIRQGKIEIAGGTGSLKTGNGFTLEPGSDFQEIEPLDIVTAGTSRFALGPTTANWSSIVDVGGLSESSPVPLRKLNGLEELAKLLPRPSKKMLLPVAAALLAAVTVFAVSYGFGWDKGPERREIARTDLELIDASLSKFPFAERLETRQEIDGAVFVTGYVASPVERRAALNAIRDTGIPAKVRISVTELIRNEIANFLDSESADLTFDLSAAGALSLNGIMLDSDRLEQLIGKLRERVMGVASITSNVRTGPSLLRDVQTLAERSKIVPLVLLRRDNDLIEASGVIPTDKIDAWAGFLQAYSTQLAPIIPLRSLVFLQDPLKPEGMASNGDDKALYLGPGTGQGDDVSVDVNRLKAGSFDLSDIFVGQPRQIPAAEALKASAAGELPIDGRPPATDGVSPIHAGTKREGDLKAPVRMVGLPFFAEADDNPSVLGISDGKDGGLDPTVESILSQGGLATMAKRLTEKADTNTHDAALKALEETKPVDEAGGLDPLVESKPSQDGLAENPDGNTHGGGQNGARLKSGVDVLDETRPIDAAGGPDPLVETKSSQDELATMARRLIENPDNNTFGGSENGAALRNGIKALEEAHPAGDATGQSSLPVRYERMLARLRSNETDGRSCWRGARLTRSNALGTLFWLDLLSVTNQLSLSKFSRQSQELMFEAALNPVMTERCVEQTDGTRPSSVYLQEVSKNPEFIRHILRDIESYALDVSGVSLAGERYIQTRGGVKFRQGSAPDEGSRILAVGELGVALERQSGYASVIFNETLNWLTR